MYFIFFPIVGYFGLVFCFYVELLVFPFSPCFNSFPLPLSHPFLVLWGMVIFFFNFFFLHVFVLFFAAFLLLEKVPIPVFLDKGSICPSKHWGDASGGGAWDPVNEARLC